MDMMFDDPRLGVVITSSEAMVLWNKSRRQIQWACWRDEVVARKAITKGTWLLTYDSCVDAWGKPEHTIEGIILEHVK